MDFLKEILGEELFKQVTEKINAHNGDEANKDNQIKVANLGGGDYVGKAKYDSLQALLDGKTGELDKANALITDLKKSAKGDEGLQQKVTEYETQVATLQAESAQIRLDNALKIALLEAKVTDIDYMTFKIKEKGDKLELDESGKVKGIDDLISGLKTQFPTQFEAGSKLKVEPNTLPKTDVNMPTVTKEDFAKMGYDSRVKLKNENPELYSQLKG
jgi:hypothetical protein